MSFKKSDLLDGDIVTQRNKEQKRYSIALSTFIMSYISSPSLSNKFSV